MNNDSGKSISVWMDTAEIANTKKLDQNVTADVCVVGAGIAGISTAYMLINEGKSVVLIDDGPLAGGETARTTAHLSSALDERFYNLEKMFGQQGAKLAGLSHAAAIDTIERIIHKEQIDCDFTRLDGYLFAADHNEGELEKELSAAHRAGMLEVTKVDRAPLPSFDTGTCLRFPKQGQFHVLKYLQGLVNVLLANGCQIYTHTKATNITAGADAKVETATGHTIHAAHIVVATNSPVNNPVTMHTKQAPYRTYAIGARIPKGSVPKALYWDNLDPYHYIRIQEMQPEADVSPSGDYDLLIVGGEDHKTGQESDPQKHFRNLTDWTRKHFPMVQDIDYQWSGQVMEPVDKLGYLGKNPGDDNVYIITGDSGHGITHTTIGAGIITDLIMGRVNPYADLYDPARITVSTGSAMEFVKENLNVASQYTDLVTGGDVTGVEQIPEDYGAILRRGMKKVAVYKDREGKTVELSAICSHLGCVVQWNDAEKSWDCPCHGSRFDPEGKVLNGPAITDLQKIHNDSRQS